MIEHPGIGKFAEHRLAILAVISRVTMKWKDSSTAHHLQLSALAAQFPELLS